MAGDEDDEAVCNAVVSARRARDRRSASATSCPPLRKVGGKRSRRYVILTCDRRKKRIAFATPKNNVNYRGNRNEDATRIYVDRSINKYVDRLSLSLPPIFTPRGSWQASVKYARSEQERNLSISGKRERAAPGEINNGGRRSEERKRERERRLLYCLAA